MCDKCEVITRQLLSYRDTHATIDDPLAVGLLAELIADIEMEMVSLHPISEGMATGVSGLPRSRTLRPRVDADCWAAPGTKQNLPVWSATSAPRAGMEVGFRDRQVGCWTPSRHEG